MLCARGPAVLCPSWLAVSGGLDKALEQQCSFARLQRRLLVGRKTPAIGAQRLIFGAAQPPPPVSDCRCDAFVQVVSRIGLGAKGGCVDARGERHASAALARCTPGLRLSAHTCGTRWRAPKKEDMHDRCSPSHHCAHLASTRAASWRLPWSCSPSTRTVLVLPPCRCQRALWGPRQALAPASLQTMRVLSSSRLQYDCLAVHTMHLCNATAAWPKPRARGAMWPAYSILCRTSSQAMARRSSFSPTTCARRCQKLFTYAVRASHALKHYKTAMYLFFAQANSPTATGLTPDTRTICTTSRLPTVPTYPPCRRHMIRTTQSTPRSALHA